MDIILTWAPKRTVKQAVITISQCKKARQYRNTVVMFKFNRYVKYIFCNDVHYRKKYYSI